MKIISMILIISLMLVSCSKDQNIPIRELDISVKSIDTISNLYHENQDVTFFPNPFNDITNLSIYSPDSAQVVIKYTDGNMMKITIEGKHNVSLDFSNEKSGVYYCEVLVDETVFRTYLIKD